MHDTLVVSPCHYHHASHDTLVVSPCHYHHVLHDALVARQCHLGQTCQCLPHLPVRRAEAPTSLQSREERAQSERGDVRPDHGRFGGSWVRRPHVTFFTHTCRTLAQMRAPRCLYNGVVFSTTRSDFA